MSRRLLTQCNIECRVKRHRLKIFDLKFYGGDYFVSMKYVEHSDSEWDSDTESDSDSDTEE